MVNVPFFVGWADEGSPTISDLDARNVGLRASAQPTHEYFHSLYAQGTSTLSVVERRGNLINEQVTIVFGNDRDGMRQFFCDCWKKEIMQMPLEPLEQQIVAVVKEHPEYHRVLEDVEQAKAREYLPELNETNPFLHMSMHLSIREQMGMDRPAGVRALMQTLVKRLGQHKAEHEMMDCLAEVLWQAQKNASAPDDQQYLQCLETKSQSIK